MPESAFELWLKCGQSVFYRSGMRDGMRSVGRFDILMVMVTVCVGYRGFFVD